ncbi:hypothetical protein BDY19DRAFT_997921 [Irpex rosettiformis]|uniref:Uncharacterized protein n=1 Tax=Irpex rosettiformis TaxID=378272 RepID=A0ACB8TQJ6_9APHY|nr:hypothetical protein BDY19DRAFT_997921 [Irpex rosettiformis]
MYSNSIIDLDEDTSTSPPLYIPPPQFRPLSPLSEPEPDGGRETMAYNLHELDDDDDQEPPLVSPVVVAHPQAVSMHPQPPLISLEARAKREAVNAPTVLQTGHVRSPILAREPSTLESFSRTIRSYVPSSIPIPSASPTPPRVSRPVSFGSFLTPARVGAPATRVLSPQTHRRSRGSEANADYRRHVTEWRDQFAEDELHSPVFNLDEDAQSTISQTKYPSGDYGEDILWSRWDTLPIDDGGFARRVLVLGYRTGLQVWDCTDLGSISEILNLNGARWTDIHQAQVLPTPSSTLAPDALAEQRPLLGILQVFPDAEKLVFYSLRTHKVIHTSSFQGLVSFSPGPQFITVATARPPALHVIASSTFVTMYIVPSSIILPFAHTQPTETNNAVPPPRQLDQQTTSQYSHISAIPQPIFASNNRLLAFASIPTTPDAAKQSSSRTPRTALPEAQPDAGLKLPISQAELGSAALKLGGSVLSGMKVLGGMAFTAARAGVTAAISSDTHQQTTTNYSPPAPGKFYSRSAPAASGGTYPEPFSPTSETAHGSEGRPERLPDSPPPREERPKGGYAITVYDLEPLKSGAEEPRLVAEFVASKDQPISRIIFSDDGTSLLVAFKDGQTMKVFKLRPTPSVFARQSVQGARSRRGSSGHVSPQTERQLDPPSYVYDLKRGRTSGVVESLDWATDGRWIAIGTRKRTIHLFATNPYGGPSDDESHLEGRVVNVKEQQPLRTELDPILRIRALKPRRGEQQPLPLAFTFVSRSTLVPSPDPYAHSFSPSSSPSSNRSIPTSPTFSSGGYNSQDQDILVFDPLDGMLSLRRIAPSRRVQEPANFSTQSPRMSASNSLPGVSTIHRLAGTAASTDKQPSALTRLMGGSTRLICQEAHIATWILRRNTDWKEIRQPIRVTINAHVSVRLAKSDWLAQAELSTCSRSPRLVPRSIYLKHQFSFFYLGEDYHALLRSHHLDVPATKVEVRRQVEVSGSGAGTGESFVSGSSLPSHAGYSSSFDEPLASALSAELRSTNPSPPVIPMYPNGPISRSLRPAIPIRNVAAGISDGMSEGLGRLRREIGKVRSPRLVPRSGDSVSASVPLEFDEEDEDFTALDIPAQGRDSRATSREAASLSTPSTGIEPLPADNEGDVSWEGWSNEDKQAVDEVEQFDDIGVGYMDEEWPRATAHPRS